jgi:hypothetical protein
MDEILFQEWSEALAALRQKRSDDIAARQQVKIEFSPADFFEVAIHSLDEILDKWLSFELVKSPDAKKPDVDQLRTELDGIFDFEVDAISRDMETVRNASKWDQGQIDEAVSKFEADTQELKKKYVLKTSGNPPPATPAATSQRRTGFDPTPSRVARGGGSGGGSGVSVISMFLVGLLLGAGPSVYFWDAAKKQDKAHQDERSKMISEQRALEDSMTMLHERFDQLATGKIPSIPQIDREIEKIRRSIGEKKKAVEAEYSRNRERLMKKTPAGDRLDAAIGSLDEQRNARLASLEAQEAQAVEPLERQKNMLQELRVR